MAKPKQETLVVAEEVSPETVTLAQDALQSIVDVSERMDRDQQRCFLGLVFRGIGFIQAEMGMTPECLRELIDGPAARAKLRASQPEERAAPSPTHRISPTIH